jgi:cellulose synthase/poly-beta-1,6-N-acetylglucosamine synthase-like glycosyltransferase
VSSLLVGVAGILAIPVAVLLGEVLAAVAAPRSKRDADSEDGARPRIAVLVPAHNEGAGLIPTLEDIKAQLAPGDRLLVVADNCSDDTAAVAARSGAEVVVRSDLERIGKGYALDHGLRHMNGEPPAVVVIIDADCRLEEGALEHLARTSAATGRPAQALYLMLAPVPSAINHQVAAFAWRVKNWVRPLGLHALGLPCQLMGTGMAFPWEAIRAVDLASGEIVEDLKLGLDLAAAGRPPEFCPSAVVTSAFPLSRAGTESQRERWEQGHIGLIVSGVPHLILSALKRRDLRLVALALDLAVPPVALLLMLLAAALGLTGLAALAGFSPLAFHISAAAFVAFTLAIVLAWWAQGRTVLPLGSLLLLPTYVWGKCRLYARLLKGERASRWVRTDRN